MRRQDEALAAKGNGLGLLSVDQNQEKREIKKLRKRKCLNPAER